MRGLASRVSDAWVSVSVATRTPRPGEREGIDYFFVTPAEFDALAEGGGLLEWAEVHGNCYGTPRAEVEAQVAAGRQVILEIDPQGAFQVKSLVPTSILVFVMPPSLEELQRRLKGRGSETEAQIKVRLGTAQRELELVGEYDHVINNDDVRRATDELARIIDSYANRPEA